MPPFAGEVGIEWPLLRESLGVEIPDANPAGLVRVLECRNDGTLKEVRVHVDITHTYIGDLRGELISPSGTAIVLHSKTGGGTDDLIADFSIAQVTELGWLPGKTCKGRCACA